MQLADSISVVKGIGPQRQSLLTAAGIHHVRELLTYLPYTYEDSSQILTISQVYDFVQKQPEWKSTVVKIAVKCTAEKCSVIRTKRGITLITATFIDKTDGKKIKALWFNQSYIQNEIQQGLEYVLFGKVKKEGATLQFNSPKFESYSERGELKKLGRITPIYRRIKTLTSTYIHSFISKLLPDLALIDPLSLDTLNEKGLPSLGEALVTLHSPQQVSALLSAKRRIAIQELHQLKESYEAKTVHREISSTSNSEGKNIARACAKLFGMWIPKLSFTLTDSQKEVLNNLLLMIERDGTLDTLVYGDVGSGKTIISHLFAFAYAKLGHISLVVAPTVILAQQHEQVALKLLELIGDPEIKISFISGKRKAFSEQTGQVVFGTQAILHTKELTKNSKVKFVCIDEQHRFGVEQRMSLQSSGRYLITLSATPIPRSLALSFLNFSSTEILSQKPIGRKEIISKVVPYGKEDITYRWMRARIDKGEQAYLVFPRIFVEDGSEKQSLLEMADQLKKEYFSGVTSALLYGGMKDSEKNEVMEKFRQGEIQVLFSTSVIEVGVDAPGATIIGIHGADLFGLAQLHQLRGRVGRSSKQSFCLLFSSEASDVAMERLEYFCAHSKGLDVAEYDLKSRGSGTILGLQQAGSTELRVASLTNISEVEEAMELYPLYKLRKGSQNELFQLESVYE